MKTSPAGGAVDSLAARRLSRIKEKNQETNMDRKEEMEMIAILRQRPDLFGLALQLIAEAQERVASRQQAAHETPR